MAVDVDTRCFTHLHIHLSDDEDADLLSTLPEATAFVRNALGINGIVLVHCDTGVPHGRGGTKCSTGGVTSCTRATSYTQLLHT